MLEKREIKRLEEWDKKYIWHPFTQMKEWVSESNLIIEKGKGSYLYDIHGNRYLDGVSSLWVTVHGHRKREIDNAIKEQLGKVAHSTPLGLSNVPAWELAKRLVGLMQWPVVSGQRSVVNKKTSSFIPNPSSLTKVFYSDSGSTSVEIALKIAFQYWQNKGVKDKTRFLTFKNAYHGDTIGSVSLGGMELFHDIYKILMIADEVATGFGRTGKMFACEHEGVVPDILCIAKGITGGYLPLAATLTNGEIHDAFLAEYNEFKTFFHGHTYTGNPLACAAAIANLDIFEHEETLKRLQPKISLLEEGLEKFNKLSHVGDIRQKGF